ncbi:MAG: RNA polymerase sigma factor [Tidjanibacter sp.]|nr:RNA polymerase sigma factor [Tidjanibacter sp.]
MTEAEFLDKFLPLKDKFFRFALSIVGDTADAEDIVQDLYERLWEYRRRVEECSNGEAFAMSTVRNLALDKLRRRKVRLNKVDEIKNISEREVGNRGENFDLTAIIDQIIASLPSKQQQVVHLRDVEGYDTDTIASIVGMECATVRVTLSRARTKIKDELQKTMEYELR